MSCHDQVAQRMHMLLTDTHRVTSRLSQSMWVERTTK